MSENKLKEKSTQIEHPLEDFFDIEKGTTDVIEVERDNSELVREESYDDKDAEIEQNYQEIYDCAMEGYDVIVQEIEDYPNNIKARMGEVSLQHLTVALNAAKHKANLKEHKDKLLVSKEKIGDKKTVNNTIVINRNDLLEQLVREEEEKKTLVIEGKIDEEG